MANEIAHQLAALQRIAAFSAAVRGHELEGWRTGEESALASCIRCGAEVRVYFPALQPEMDGPAYEHLCGKRVVAGRAA
jgi:hypothetical protein